MARTMTNEQEREIREADEAWFTDLKILFAELDAERAAHEETKQELADANAARSEMIRLKELHLEGGRFDAALVGDAVSIMAGLMVQWYRDAGGPNYCGVGMSDRKTGETFEMTLQRVNGKSPQVVAAELREELTALKARLKLAEAVCESCSEDWPFYDDDALAAWRAGK